ncbi:TadE/TadG family type IV pilus assembly protein [Tsuneonella amylolytica]|uniref:TadE/TadG family type IV pilus assembly protein n=1 Tax=Tsuneonella amylolytica TaxID=2338327 RepID=UPI000EAA0E6F|nr:pilus assembly protein [Tsuneonella amylolytica]
MIRLSALVRRILRSRSGTALTEFALAAPVLMAAGLWGVETANQAIVQMRINQIAVLVADNAARVGENSLLGEAKVYEADINDVLYGAHVQNGSSSDFYDHGRVILSSLEVVPDTEDTQYIHWQRCMGKLTYASSYGVAGDGKDGRLAGLGPPGEEIIAYKGEAVMFVEVAYVYQPIISDAFTAAGTLTATAAFNVRENRDLTDVYQSKPSAPDPVADCTRHQNIAEYYG